MYSPLPDTKFAVETFEYNFKLWTNAISSTARSCRISLGPPILSHPYVGFYPRGGSAADRRKSRASAARKGPDAGRAGHSARRLPDELLRQARIREKGPIWKKFR